MLDFMMISTRTAKNGVVEIYPNFLVKNPSRHLMIRGGDFYAVWVEERGLWSQSEQDVIEMVDRELEQYARENGDKFPNGCRVMRMVIAETGMIDRWHKFCQKQMRDTYHMLDETLIFANMEVTREDYASKRLPYPLTPGDPKAWNRLLSVLYAPEERHKIEWAIGSIVSGDSRRLQKFMVFYGAAGTGKSTIIHVVEQLFEGYTCVFRAKALGASSNSFALEAFRDNPLVAIEHDGDLSRIEDNTMLNSLVSHEKMSVNEKFKSSYVNRFKCFLFMGTNRPVQITDAKSGLIRRLIDVSPTGEKIPPAEYRRLMQQIPFELGAIASQCQQVYLDAPGAYDDYVPVKMLGASNDFYNFVMDSWAVFKREDETTLKAAWEMYKTYCEETKVPYPYPQRRVKEELKNYFREYRERDTAADGSRVRNCYRGFLHEKFEGKEQEASDASPTALLELADQPSLLDRELADCPAQYAGDAGTPLCKWAKVTTRLRDLDTSRLHYVKPPENHIVIDFDMMGEDGEKDYQRNLEEASKWPPTYAEVSKSGKGIHLHYLYTGDPAELSCVYDNRIEVKVFAGKSSLRRQRTRCNNLPVASLSCGLPLKEKKKMVNFDAVQSERGLRRLILRNLGKEIHPGTKPSIDFICKILEDAYASDLAYDVSDMRPAVIAFAARSSHHADYCLQKTAGMRFRSREETEETAEKQEPRPAEEAPLTFYDIEVFPNLLLVVCKAEGEGKKPMTLLNPTPRDVEQLLRLRLVGFNCRRYDNHILYGALMGFTPEQIYQLSSRIISGDRSAFFSEAYDLSYTDVYDFAAKKQSLKKWEIELGIHHLELGLPWDQPVCREMWDKVAEYCANDVIATEAVFHHLQGDFTARRILADIAGMSVNDTTNSLTTRIIFGRERHPQLVYTDLSTGLQEGPVPEDAPKVENAFPGYAFRTWQEGDSFRDDGKRHNMYRGTDLGKGGYIRSWPGVYTHVALLDVASLHPNSIRAMSCFGGYTKNFIDLLEARLAIKHRDFDRAKSMLDGRLARYLDDPAQAKDLAKALKIAINSVYGLTAASFDNPFRDPRNVNNIVALRGALFMRTLQDEVAQRGFQIVAIKTDSIKIADATPEIIQFCTSFASRYGYQFEHEATYEKMCQINDADYIARYETEEGCRAMYGYIPEKNGEEPGKWTATGAQFAVPYVFKTLFSREPIVFEDMCETREVKTSMVLDMNLGTEDEERSFRFVGKVGEFCPMKEGGGELLRDCGDGRYSAVTGTKGRRWLESEIVRELGLEKDIDRGYYDELVNAARDKIAALGDAEWFLT